MIRIAPALELPFHDQPGRCPLCGAEVRPRADEVFPIGCWDGRNPAGERTGGLVFGVNCPVCGAVLENFLSEASWKSIESAQVVWHTDGRRFLVGGDWRLGRLGAWSLADASGLEGRLRKLVARSGSLEEAILTLHLTTGVGGLDLSGVVERVAGLPAEVAKRMIVRALAPGMQGS